MAVGLRCRSPRLLPLVPVESGLESGLVPFGVRSSIICVSVSPWHSSGTSGKFSAQMTVSSTQLNHLLNVFGAEHFLSD